MKKLIALLAITALCACETNTVLDERAVEHNIALENTKNKIALLNVIRSSEGLPMTFSRLGSLKYTTARGPGTTWAAPLGGLVDDAASLTFAPAINDSNVADFDALNGEEFYKSILASVEPSRVKYYRDRGFSDEIVFSLFIERIEFPDDSLCPSEETITACEAIRGRSVTLAVLGETIFKNLGTHIQNRAIEASSQYNSSDAYIGRRLAILNDPDDPEQYLVFRQMMKNVIDNYLVELKSGPSSQKTLYNVSQIKPDAATLPKGATIDRNGNVIIDVPGKPIVKFYRESQRKSDERASFSGSSDTEQDIEIVFRSPSSILYYLGEMQRAQTHRSIIERYKTACGSQIYGWDDRTHSTQFRRNGFRIGLNNPCASENVDEPFFYIESEPFDRARVSQIRHDLDYYGFEYQGRYYWVSRDINKRGRTMQNITLVNELFDQKQKASEAPRVTVLQGRTF